MLFLRKSQYSDFRFDAVIIRVLKIKKSEILEIWFDAVIIKVLISIFQYIWDTILYI